MTQVRLRKVSSPYKAAGTAYSSVYDIMINQQAVGSLSGDRATSGGMGYHWTIKLKGRRLHPPNCYSFCEIKAWLYSAPAALMEQL